MSSIVRFRKEDRLEKIKLLLPSGKSLTDIAKECGVNERTIRRDIRDWNDGGGFEDWLRSEFFELHGRVKSEKVALAYSKVSMLLGRTLKVKSETEVKGELGLVVKAWDIGIAERKRDNGKLSAAPETSGVP